MEIDWVRKLTSRKLWAAVAEFVGMLLVALHCTESVAAQVTALILSGAAVIAFIFAEGWADAANATHTTIYYDANEEGKEAE